MSTWFPTCSSPSTFTFTLTCFWTWRWRSALLSASSTSWGTSSGKSANFRWNIEPKNTMVCTLLQNNPHKVENLNFKVKVGVSVGLQEKLRVPQWGAIRVPSPTFEVALWFWTLVSRDDVNSNIRYFGKLSTPSASSSMLLCNLFWKARLLINAFGRSYLWF